MRGRLRFWRTLLFVFFAGVIVAAGVLRLDHAEGVGLSKGEYIARITIDGLVTDDFERREILNEIAENNAVKAVIMYVDTPGGTASGGEALYDTLKKIQEKKPLVTVMGGMATSAGYMISLPSDKIFARRSTVTGSIGVLFQAPNFSGMLQKLGVAVDTFSSGAVKGQPSYVDDISPEARATLQALIDDFHQAFVEMVTSNRTISAETLEILSDGRVVSGDKALEYGLIDAIGDEDDALQWLYDNKEISSDWKVKEVELQRKKNTWERLNSAAASLGGHIFPSEFSLHGLLLLTQNAMM